MTESDYRNAQRKLAEAVRTRRQQLGFTQEEAAHATDMATRHFQKLEAGELNVTLRTLVRVARALKMELGELFSNVDIKE